MRIFGSYGQLKSGTMKKVLFPLLMGQILTANGQTSVYRPFPTTYGNWVYQYYNDFHYPTGSQTQYTLSGDTTISIHAYKKIFINSNYTGALRENSKIVYFIPDTSSTEYVLYNFNLTVGDTIIHPFGGAVCTNDTLTVAAIDSVLLSDGYHKRFIFDPFGPGWIEGVGSYCYLLEPLQVYCLSGNDVLECMTSDEVFNYPVSSSSCFLPVTEYQAQSGDISVFPNPSNGSFTVDFDNADIKEVIIIDMLGRVVYRPHIYNKTKIEVEGIPIGTYFLIAVDNYHRQTIRKIVSCP